MNPLSIHRDDKKTRGGLGETLGCGSVRASICDHKFKPERLPSWPAGRRSLRAGCAGRRQSGARVGLRRPAFLPPIRPTRLGRFFANAPEFMNFVALERAGLGAGIAAQVAAQFVPQAAQHAVQSLADVPESHSSKSLSCGVAGEAIQPRGRLNEVHENPASGASHDC